MKWSQGLLLTLPLPQNACIHEQDKTGRETLTTELDKTSPAAVAHPAGRDNGRRAHEVPGHVVGSDVAAAVWVDPPKDGVGMGHRPRGPSERKRHIPCRWGEEGEIPSTNIRGRRLAGGIRRFVYISFAFRVHLQGMCHNLQGTSVCK